MAPDDTSIGGRLWRVIVGVPQGAVWLFETIPITTIIVFSIGPIGFVVLLIAEGRPEFPIWPFICLAFVMLAEGYFGQRNAKHEEQKRMNDFLRWHSEEMEKLKRG